MNAKRIADWAAELKVGLKTIRRAIRRGQLNAVQFGRGPNSPFYATEADINAWLEDRKVNGRRLW